MLEKILMFRYNELILTLVKKDFKLRYRNSLLGFIWSIFNPLLMMLVLATVFSIIFRVDIENYPVFLLVGLLPWRFFQLSTMMSLNSIVGNAPLVTKIYFPRHILVLSGNLANLLASSLEFIVLIPLMLFMGMRLDVLALLLPIVLGLEFLFIFGTSLILSSLNVFLRDVSQIWEITLQLGFFLTPILYAIDFIPTKYHLVYSLNPMMRVIQLIRKILFYSIVPTFFDFAIVLVAGILFIIIGLVVFNRLEPRFAEEV